VTKIKNLRDSPSKLKENKIVIFVFFLALVYRLFFSYIFFGSIDTINFANSIHAYSDSEPFNPLPYLTLIPASLKMIGLLSFLELPSTFIVKIIPNIFDAAIAAYIVKGIGSKTNRLSVWAGLFYALNPLSIVLTSLHGQWDAMWIFFGLLSLDYAKRAQSKRAQSKRAQSKRAQSKRAQSKRAQSLSVNSSEYQPTYILVGFLFTTALFIKPSAILLTPIIAPYFFRKDSKLQIKEFIAGVSLSIFCNYLIALSLSLDPIDLISQAIAYATSTFGIFGTPYGVLAIEENFYKIFLLTLFVITYILNHRKRISSTNAAIFIICAYLAIAPLAPQYLIWVLPFLLVGERYIESIAVSFIFALFLFAYYMNPMASYSPYENSATFSPRSGMSFLTPFLNYDSTVYLDIANNIQRFGNYVVPMIFLALALRSIKAPKISLAQKPQRNLGSWSASEGNLSSFKAFYIYSFGWLSGMLIILNLIPDSLQAQWDSNNVKSWSEYEVAIEPLGLAQFPGVLFGREQEFTSSFAIVLVTLGFFLFANGLFFLKQLHKVKQSCSTEIVDQKSMKSSGDISPL
jgi:hypothetical protein